MSRNAVEACARTATPLIGLERPPWQAGPGDDWRPVADPAAAVAHGRSLAQAGADIRHLDPDPIMWHRRASGGLS